MQQQRHLMYLLKAVIGFFYRKKICLRELFRFAVYYRGCLGRQKEEKKGNFLFKLPTFSTRISSNPISDKN